MKNEYVIISKTAIQKRIEELEKTKYPTLRVDLEILKQILSQSTPLIPEIEKAFDAGSAYCVGSNKLFKQIHPNKKDYISNLKLDI